MASTNPEAVVARMIERFGGREKFFQTLDKRYEEFSAVWQQDSDRLGRVLRAHLAVEHFLTLYLAAQNPKLGSIDRARLSYAQKVELLDSGTPLVNAVLPGLRLLGQIRNRIAHRLKVELTEEDQRAFLDVELFRAAKAERDKRLSGGKDKAEDDDRLTVLEQFAEFAAGLFYAGADPDSDIWREAVSEFAKMEIRK